VEGRRTEVWFFATQKNSAHRVQFHWTQGRKIGPKVHRWKTNQLRPEILWYSKTNLKSTRGKGMREAAGGKNVHKAKNRDQKQASLKKIYSRKRERVLCWTCHLTDREMKSHHKKKRKKRIREKKKKNLFTFKCDRKRLKWVYHDPLLESVTKLVFR